MTEERLEYLKLLAKEYPSVGKASTEIINLEAVLHLPKGTEYFISDIHGEHEAFLHLMNSASGVVREKIDLIFSGEVPQKVRDELATLVYYPEDKIKEMKDLKEDYEEWCFLILHRLLRLCRYLSTKYTRAKVSKALPEGFRYILDELLFVPSEDYDKKEYFERIISTIIETGQGEAFILAVTKTIKQLAVDELHVVGDIYDRGPRADVVMSYLEHHHNVDIQWGNHDILWMGAATGSRTLVATVLANSIHYNNLAVLELGYGISLRPLATFAKETYQNCDCSRFKVKISSEDQISVTEKDEMLYAQMHKAVTIIMLKLEGKKLSRRTEFDMADRLLLDKIDYENKTICIKGVTHPLLDCDFPTVDPADPYSLTEEEERVIVALTNSFVKSEKLQAHIQLLYKKGALYKVHNQNLLFHGCVPMTDSGEFLSFSHQGVLYSGKDYFDFSQKLARRAYYEKTGTPEREFAMDFLWFLWAGRNSPLFGRDCMTTFERRFIEDESTWSEKKNAYYTLYQERNFAEKILLEFGLEGDRCHIINGHTPVKTKHGESPLKADGKLIVIDGGFCKAYQPTTGIAGYTMVFNSQFYRLISHESFIGTADAIEKNIDMNSTSLIFERMEERIKVKDTDDGVILQKQIDDLKQLLYAYQHGYIQEIFES